MSMFPSWLGSYGSGEPIIVEKIVEKVVEIPIYGTEYVTKGVPKINIEMIDILIVKVPKIKKTIYVRSYPI